MRAESSPITVTWVLEASASWRSSSRRAASAAARRERTTKNPPMATTTNSGITMQSISRRRPAACALSKAFASATVQRLRVSSPKRESVSRFWKSL